LSNGWHRENPSKELGESWAKIQLPFLKKLEIIYSSRRAVPTEGVSMTVSSEKTVVSVIYAINQDVIASVASAALITARVCVVTIARKCARRF
jgi:hypothetical protein